MQVQLGELDQTPIFVADSNKACELLAWLPERSDPATIVAELGPGKRFCGKSSK
jgi:hypothetical protein